METAIEWIVDKYVRLENRQALEDLRAHRQRMLADLKGKPDHVYDFSAPIQQLETEIAIIDHGLETLTALSVASDILSGGGQKPGGQEGT
jgi:hypothetical protein